ncbi:uncharacterized protein LOC131667572 [Phymastichus coffea]|uniref:uncharacterized protein LOC131667572 n=1 Tax=Phymastichus coffea TaxID=108790 RepID=UPI00273BDDC6|nr:uncharacterized protein LOC131667572 [Phymastichus coffea]
MKRLAAVCLVTVCYSADGDFDYEEEESAAAAPAPPPAKANHPKSAGKLGALLSPRNRGAGSLAPRKSPVAAAAAASPKTTTTTEATAELTEEDYEEGAEGEEKHEIVTTTTEAPKKKGRGGGVRPFRSNEDLLAALKRRRAQGLSSITKEPSSTQVPTEAGPSKSKSQSSSRAKTNEVSKSAGRASPRFGGSRSKAAVQEEAEETKTEDVKAKPYRARG